MLEHALHAWTDDSSHLRKNWAVLLVFGLLTLPEVYISSFCLFVCLSLFLQMNCKNLGISHWES